MSRPCTLGMGCREAGMCYAAQMNEPNRCDARPDEPDSEGDVWYRGWECGFDGMAHDYSGEGWRAYKGGCDLDAKQVSAKRGTPCWTRLTARRTSDGTV